MKQAARPLLLVAALVAAVGGCSGNTDGPIVPSQNPKADARALLQAFQHHCIATFPNLGEMRNSLKDKGFQFAADDESAVKGPISIQFGDASTAHGEYVGRYCIVRAELSDRSAFTDELIQQMSLPSGEALNWVVSENDQRATLEAAGRRTEIIAHKPYLMSEKMVDDQTGKTRHVRQWTGASFEISAFLTKADLAKIRQGADLPAFFAR